MPQGTDPPSPPDPAAGGRPDPPAPAATPSSGTRPVGRTDPRVRQLTVLGVAAVLLVAVAALLATAAYRAAADGPQANEAFVDTAATAEVVGQTTQAIITVYSYDYTNLPATEAAAKQVVTGKFAGEFDRVFQPVKKIAPQEQAVLRSTVPAAAVSELHGDRARLLMMVDQAGTRGPDKRPTGATARLVVDAVKLDGRWKISEVSPE